MNYIAVLYENERFIDTTNIDENSFELAEHLFFNDFGHEKTEGAIYEIKIYPE